MPSFFTFQQGSEAVARPAHAQETSPLLGRFRAVPQAGRSFGRRKSVLGLGASGALGHGTTSARRDSQHEMALAEDEDDEDEDEGEDNGDSDAPKRKSWSATLRNWSRRLRRLWLQPKQRAVGACVDTWWSRGLVLWVLPATLVGGGGTKYTWKLINYGLI